MFVYLYHQTFSKATPSVNGVMDTKSSNLPNHKYAMGYYLSMDLLAFYTLVRYQKS